MKKFAPCHLVSNKARNQTEAGWFQLAPLTVKGKYLRYNVRKKREDKSYICDTVYQNVGWPLSYCPRTSAKAQGSKESNQPPMAARAIGLNERPQNSRYQRMSC